MEHSGRDLYEMRAVVKGHVQGVGFRVTARYFAMDLGLKGTVRNCEDGSVEIYAQGSKGKLEDFIKKIESEFGKDHIEQTSIEYFPIENPHEDFQIIF